MQLRGLAPLLLMLLLPVAAACGGREEGTADDAVAVSIACGADLGLSPEDALQPDWSGEPRAWARARDGDRITLRRSGSCGDECSFRVEIVLARGDGGCPRFVSAARTRSEAGGALGRVRETTTARRGSLLLQDWSGLAGLVSGRLESEVNATFWVGETEAESEP